MFQLKDCIILHTFQQEMQSNHSNQVTPIHYQYNPPVPMANNQLNWSHFRPEFSGEPEEDAGAHLLRTEDWMTTHNFPEDQKV